MITCATEDLVEEIAYVAHHLHWSFAEILDLEHPLRRQFVEQAGRLVQAADGR